MVIIDEISLVDSDLFYKIDLRLREITQMGVPLGNNRNSCTWRLDADVSNFWAIHLPESKK